VASCTSQSEWLAGWWGNSEAVVLNSQEAVERLNSGQSVDFKIETTWWFVVEGLDSHKNNSQKGKWGVEAWRPCYKPALQFAVGISTGRVTQQGPLIGLRRPSASSDRTPFFQQPRPREQKAVARQRRCRSWRAMKRLIFWVPELPLSSFEGRATIPAKQVRPIEYSSAESGGPVTYASLRWLPYVADSSTPVQNRSKYL